MAETVVVPKAESQTPEPAPAPEPAPEVLEAKRKEWLKAEFGVEDAGEIKKWKAAADELPQAKHALDRVLRNPPPLPPQRQEPQRPQLDMEKIREYGRIDPVGAYMALEEYKKQERQQEMEQERQRTAATTSAMLQYQSDATAAEKYLRDELPEVYDPQSDLQREAVAIFNSHPYYQQSGQGMRLAAEVAAARLGYQPKSKRPAVAPTREVAGQEVERGTRKPRVTDAKDDAPLSPMDRKLMRDMDLDEKSYRAAKQARRDGKNIRVE